MNVIELINSLTNQVIYIINEIGYIAVVIITGMEYACFPLMPSEVILPLIGISAATGDITFWGALLASIIGGLIGSLLCYLVGYYGGGALIEELQTKFPKTQNSVETINKWFEKYGKFAVLFTRLIPLTRTYISVIAGASKFNKTTFCLFSVIGIITWNSILISLGYFLGNNWSYIELIMKQYSILVSAIIAIAAGLLIYKKIRNKK